MRLGSLSISSFRLSRYEFQDEDFRSISGGWSRRLKVRPRRRRGEVVGCIVLYYNTWERLYSLLTFPADDRATLCIEKRKVQENFILISFIFVYLC